MMLIDTSAWIEFLRDSGSATQRVVTGVLHDERPFATTDVIVAELAAGAGDERQARQLLRLLDRGEFVPIRPLFDYEAAASIYRKCRAAGLTPRGLSDCLIAAVAIERDLPVVHLDRDFDAIAEVTALRVA